MARLLLGLAMRRREFITFLGGAAASPLAAHAQQSAMPVVGFMSGRSPEDFETSGRRVPPRPKRGRFRRGPERCDRISLGLGQYDRMPALAADLVNRRVAVLVGVGGDVSALAAKRATSTIPIVFGTGSDPIKAGMVESLARPGGNATGYSLLTNQMEPKRLNMLHDLVPGAAVIGVLLNPNFPPAARQLQDLEEAARTIGQKLFVSKASNDVALNAAFTSLVQQRVEALLVAADPYFDTRRDEIIAFANQNRLPAIYQFREYAIAGGLISYGPSITDLYRQAGIYAGRILKGAKPADLPVVQPTTFDFVINLKTAKAIGFTVPQGLVNAADEVIE